MPDSIKYLYEACFCKCDCLTTIHWSERLEVIGPSAFNECTSLNEIIIPNSVRVIQSDAFRHCKNLKKVTINKGCDVDPHAFANTGVSEVIIDYPITVHKRTDEFTDGGVPALKPVTINNYQELCEAIVETPNNPFADTPFFKDIVLKTGLSEPTSPKKDVSKEKKSIFSFLKGI